jgi:hypothetical protein
LEDSVRLPRKLPMNALKYKEGYAKPLKAITGNPYPNSPITRASSLSI